MDSQDRIENKDRIENRKAITWIAQSTMDYTFRHESIDHLIATLNRLMEKNILSQYHPNFREFCSKGLIKDFEDKKVPEGKEIKQAAELLDQRLESVIKTIIGGGSPYISAEFSSHLHQTNHLLPQSYFCGNLPKPVQNYIAGKKELEEMCVFALRVEKYPGTLSLEIPPYKIMLASSEGRKLDEFDQNKFITNLKTIVEKHGPENTILAIGGLNSDPAKKYVDLIQKVKKEFPELKIFIGTNSFAKKSPEEIKKYWEVLCLGDIISFNDEELKTIYDAVYSPRSIPLARKLKELEHPGIKICHAAEGAILDPGYYPEKIIGNPIIDNPKAGQELLVNPKEFLERILTLAADGATYIYERSKKLGYPSYRAIQIYSQNIRCRWEDGFRVKFVYPDNALTNGLLGVAAAKVDYSLGRQTGTGAFFDAGIVSYLLSHNFFGGKPIGGTIGGRNDG